MGEETGVIACEDDDVLAERKGLGYGMDCRIRGHVFYGFPPKEWPRHLDQDQYDRYRDIYMNRRLLYFTHAKSIDDDNKWRRALA